MITIREETPADHDAVYEVNRRAFESDAEPRLVEQLRSGGDSIASLVAVEDGTIVGHILFSRIFIGAIEAVSLAPMAVDPPFQRRGIGSALVRAGLELCRARGERSVIVLGHPSYYPRFGFSAALAGSLRGPWDGGEAWMALELAPGALEGVEGDVKFPEAFRAFT